MAWTTPQTVVADSTELTAALWNEQVRDNLDVLGMILNTSSASVATIQNTTSTTYTDLATVGPSVTVDTGTEAIVIVSAFIDCQAANRDTYMSFAVSGATTISASDSYAARCIGITVRATERVTRVNLLTGLTAGSNTFVAKYRSATGGNVQFDNRDLIVITLP